MKQKIKEALRQEYKSRLELNDDQLEGVAAFAATFVTEEGKIEEFVKNDATLTMLKSYQSMLDKDRAKRKADGEQGQQPSDNGNQPPKTDPETKPQDDEKIPAWAQALIDSNKTMSEQLATFKAEQSAKTALSTAEQTFKGNDYVKKYADEATDAWERATEMYEATGKSWTAEQLQEKAMGYFNKAVAKKGVDTSKPFDSDGGGGDDPKARFEAFAKRQAERAAGAVAE